MGISVDYRRAVPVKCNVGSGIVDVTFSKSVEIAESILKEDTLVILIPKENGLRPKSVTARVNALEYSPLEIATNILPDFGQFCQIQIKGFAVVSDVGHSLSVKVFWTNDNN